MDDHVAENEFGRKNSLRNEHEDQEGNSKEEDEPFTAIMSAFYNMFSAVTSRPASAPAASKSKSNTLDAAAVDVEMNGKKVMEMK